MQVEFRVLRGERTQSLQGSLPRRAQHGDLSQCDHSLREGDQRAKDRVPADDVPAGKNR